MSKLIGQLVFGFICGYLVIKWVPLSFPFSFGDLLVEFILNPLEFFLAVIAFVIGIVLNGELISHALTKTIALVKKEKVSLIELITTYIVFVSIFILFQFGVWQASVFLCFSVIYGMLSIDANTFWTKNRHHL